jgi:hypothetical protein
MPVVFVPGLYDMGLLFLARFTYGASVPALRPPLDS